MAKLLASDAVDLACRSSLQCHGAIAYTVEYDLQLWLKRGWALAAARIGVVLTPRGGLLGRVLLPAQFGIASVFGAGDQYVSWIALDDLLGGLTQALLDDGLRGPVNMTAPAPVTPVVETRYRKPEAVRP